MKITHCFSDGTKTESIEGCKVPTDSAVYKVIAEERAKRINETVGNKQEAV